MKKNSLLKNLGLKLVIEALLSVVFVSSLSFSVFAGTWEQDSKGWKYSYTCSDSPLPHYAQDDSLFIEDSKYAFNEEGYMVTGWWNDAWGDWYYFNEDGKMRYEPLNEDGKTYYFDEDGECLNSDGQAISQYELAIRNLAMQDIDLVSSINLSDSVDIEMLKAHISAVDRLTAEVNNLPKDIPNKYKILHAHLLAYTQQLGSKVALLRQIVANVESPNTDYQKLIRQIEEYNGEKIGLE